MRFKSRRFRLLILSTILLVGVGSVQFVTGIFDYIPRLRVSALSPDGALTVRVYQKRLMPRPFFPRMGAIAKVYDRNGNLVYEDTFFRDSDWDDTLGNAFTNISFEGDEIRIGPGFYESAQVYAIKRSNLKLTH